MIIFLYLSRELLKSFVAITVVLTTVFVVSRFSMYLGDAAAGYISGDVVWRILLFRMPSFLELVLPLAWFLAVMLSFGRFYVDSEMAVLRACGHSKARLLRYTLGPSVLVMTAVFMLTVWLTPVGWDKFNALYEKASQSSNFSALVPGSFRRLNDQRNTVIYTGGLEDKKSVLRDVFMFQQTPEQGLLLVRADSGRIVYEQDATYVELQQGTHTQGKFRQLDFTVMQFERFGQLMRQDREPLETVETEDTKSTTQLWQSSSVRDRATLHWRLGLPFLVPIGAMIALALSETSHRRGRYKKLLPGVVILMAYLISLIGMRLGVAKGTIPHVAFFWLVHVIFLLLGSMLLFSDQWRVTWQTVRRAGK